MPEITSRERRLLRRNEIKASRAEEVELIQAMWASILIESPNLFDVYIGD